jgi:hypothetical protein
MEIELVAILVGGDDRLEVRGTVDGQPVVAWGWVSATTNHYGPADYGPDGHLIAGATARSMTQDELRAYGRSLILPPPPPVAHPLFVKEQ